MQPHAISIGSYVNGMAEPDADRIRASYGDKYDRLLELKRKYDPDNVFHRNQNINPAAAGS
jgi:FAD/FMN-containing dehydrogenase